MQELPVLETARLLIRPFVMADLEDAYRLLDVELNAQEMGAEKLGSIEERAEWLQWVVLNYRQLARLNQPPYGDRAVILKATGALIGACGYVPTLNAYEQIPVIEYHNPSQIPGRYSTEFGLFYAISPAHQRRGYAVEAAAELIRYAFAQLRVKRVIAETDFENAGSIAVMQKLGMNVGRNPLAEPPWLQVVGILENSA